jgi:copper chaperone CopZ
MQKNAASQKWIVFAFDRTDNTPKTGDAANITANLRIDGGGANAVDDTNPTELEDGFYAFDLTQAETNGDSIVICPASSTSDIQVVGCPAAVYPVTLSDYKADVSSLATSSALSTVSGKIDTIDGIVDNILVDTSTTLDGKLNTIDGIVDDILVDTNELQTNQGNWTTATGFSTHAAADVWSVGTRAITDKAGFSISGTKTTLDALNDFDPTTQEVTTDAASRTASKADVSNLDATISSRAPASEYDTEMARITANVATESKQDTIDTVVDAIQAKTDNLPADPADQSEVEAAISALNDISVADIISGIADGTYDLQEMLRIMFAALAGKSSGGGTSTITFRDAADSKNRISATVDSNGNRTAITLDES